MAEKCLSFSLQLKGERNYHIFYRILAGMNSRDLAKLHLVNDPWKYCYLTKVRERGGGENVWNRTRRKEGQREGGREGGREGKGKRKRGKEGERDGEKKREEKEKGVLQ